MVQKIYALLSAGSVEYGKSEAEVDIEEFIQALEQAREDGATHVLGLSGNYRGASYVRLGMPEVDYDESEESDEDDDDEE
jgi:hypothetical protein